MSGSGHESTGLVARHSHGGSAVGLCGSQVIVAQLKSILHGKEESSPNTVWSLCSRSPAGAGPPSTALSLSWPQAQAARPLGRDMLSGSLQRDINVSFVEHFQ